MNIEKGKPLTDNEEHFLSDSSFSSVDKRTAENIAKRIPWETAPAWARFFTMVYTEDRKLVHGYWTSKRPFLDGTQRGVINPDSVQDGQLQSTGEISKVAGGFGVAIHEMRKLGNYFCWPRFAPVDLQLMVPWDRAPYWATYYSIWQVPANLPDAGMITAAWSDHEPQIVGHEVYWSKSLYAKRMTAPAIELHDDLPKIVKRESFAVDLSQVPIGDYPAVDWSVAPSWANWYVWNMGNPMWFSHEPHFHQGCWLSAVPVREQRQESFAPRFYAHKASRAYTEVDARMAIAEQARLAARTERGIDLRYSDSSQSLREAHRGLFQTPNPFHPHYPDQRFWMGARNAELPRSLMKHFIPDTHLKPDRMNELKHRAIINITSRTLANIAEYVEQTIASGDDLDNEFDYWEVEIDTPKHPVITEGVVQGLLVAGWIVLSITDRWSERVLSNRLTRFVFCTRTYAENHPELELDGIPHCRKE